MIVWSPLPPNPSGIAAFSEAVFSEMSDVQIVSDASAVGVGAKTHSPALLQMGNNIHHDFVFDRALRGGDVLELHDMSLHHLLVSQTLAKGDKNGYRKYLEQEDPKWGRLFALQRQKGMHCKMLEFNFRCLKPVLSSATGAVVHSAWARRLLDQMDLGIPIHEIPHFTKRHIDLLCSERTKKEARATLKFDPDETVILSAGFVTKPKKVDWVLDALEKAYANGSRFKFVIAGECKDEGFLQRLETSKISHLITVTGYLEANLFDLYLLASDVVPVLRYPSVGESSGVAAAGLGLGKKVIVCDYMSYSELSEGFATVIDPINNPAAQLVRIFEDAIAEAPIEDDVVQCDYYAQTQSLSVVRDKYLDMWRTYE